MSLPNFCRLFNDRRRATLDQKINPDVLWIKKPTSNRQTA
jgi:hypothetical protein